MPARRRDLRPFEKWSEVPKVLLTSSWRIAPKRARVAVLFYAQMNMIALSSLVRR